MEIIIIMVFTDDILDQFSMKSWKTLKCPKISKFFQKIIEKLSKNDQKKIIFEKKMKSEKKLK